MRGKKRATYNHFDSDPDCLGADVAKFVHSLSSEQLEKMKEMVENIQWYQKNLAHRITGGTDSISRVEETDPPSQELQERYVRCLCIPKNRFASPC